MKTSRIFVSSLALLFVLGGQSYFGEDRPQRDLTKYENGGAFDFRWSVTGEARRKMASELRDFVWRQWTEKRLGYVVATYYTIEGDPTTYNLFVEPDANQRWHVVAKYESECCWNYGLEKPPRPRKRETGVAQYDIVERIATPRERGAYTLRLRKTGARASDGFVL